jgi:hypothetical protein
VWLDRNAEIRRPQLRDATMQLDEIAVVRATLIEDRDRISER